jgi:hypothetical protein
VRYGDDVMTRHMENRHHKNWTQVPEDAEFFRANPAPVRVRPRRSGTGPRAATVHPG